MAYTILEYPKVMDGEPVQPPSVRTEDRASANAYRLTGADTVFVAIIPDADMYFRVSLDGAAATDSDYFLSAGQTYGFPVRKGVRPYVYGLDAA